MKYWPKMQVEPALLGPGLLCSYSRPACYEMETNHRIRPPWIWVIICFNFHVTSFNSIKSKIMQQRRIWSHLPTYLIPTAQEDPGCALDCTYNFRLKAPSSFIPTEPPQFRLPQSLCSLPHQEKLLLGFLQPSKLCNSLINSIPLFL